MIPIIRDTEAEARKVAAAMTERNQGWRGMEATDRSVRPSSLQKRGRRTSSSASSTSTSTAPRRSTTRRSSASCARSNRCSSPLNGVGEAGPLPPRMQPRFSLTLCRARRAPGKRHEAAPAMSVAAAAATRLGSRSGSAWSQSWAGSGRPSPGRSRADRRAREPADRLAGHARVGDAHRPRHRRARSSLAEGKPAELDGGAPAGSPLPAPATSSGSCSSTAGCASGKSASSLRSPPPRARSRR